jgi:hypothetical protein
MIQAAELDDLERAFDDVGLSRGPTRCGRYETMGPRAEQLWLLVIGQTIRMPITGAVMCPAGTVVVRNGAHDLLFEAHPPCLTGEGWALSLEVELWFDEDEEGIRRRHAEHFVPMLGGLGLAMAFEESDDEGLRSSWEVSGVDPATVACLAKVLLGQPWIWSEPPFGPPS